MRPDPFIFMEIAAQQDRGGATPTIIREGVDYRQKIRLSELELNDALKNLEIAGLVRTKDGRYFVTESYVSALPRTATGALSFRRRDWDALRQTLFDT